MIIKDITEPEHRTISATNMKPKDVAIDSDNNIYVGTDDLDYPSVRLSDGLLINERHCIEVRLLPKGTEITLTV